MTAVEIVLLAIALVVASLGVVILVRRANWRLVPLLIGMSLFSGGSLLAAVLVLTP